MKVKELEDKVWKQDQIRIVIRAKSQDEVDSYSHKKAAQGNWRITQFLQKRMRPLIGSAEVEAINGDGEQVHRGTLLKTIRESYN